MKMGLVSIMIFSVSLEAFGIPAATSEIYDKVQGECTVKLKHKKKKKFKKSKSWTATKWLEVLEGEDVEDVANSADTTACEEAKAQCDSDTGSLTKYRHYTCEIYRQGPSKKNKTHLREVKFTCGEEGAKPEFYDEDGDGLGIGDGFWTPGEPISEIYGQYACVYEGIATEMTFYIGLHN